MKQIDMRFEKEKVKGLLGKAFVMYKCDAFDYTNSVTQMVGLYIGDKTYALTNVQEYVDYYGDEEDVAVFKFGETDECNIQSAFRNTEMISTPINGRIEKIYLVNDNQTVTENGFEQYNVWLTRGMVFFVDGHEISFEKDSIPFSEEIIIRRGYDLVDKMISEKEFLESWGEGVEPRCFRQIEELSVN